MIALLGSSIETLDLSSNFIGTPNAQTFKRFTNLKYLNLSQTNLPSFLYATFFNQQKLQVLDLSYNHLKKIDFRKSLRNFKDLNTLNLEGNDLTDVNSVTNTIFPKLSSLAISKNRFSCDYLSTFLLQWNDLQLRKNPSNETHIDGVDCHEEVQSTTKSVNVKDGPELQTSTTVQFNWSTPNSTSVITNVNRSYENHKLVDIESSSLSADVRVLKYLFVTMILMYSGYLVVKFKLIKKIKQRIIRNSLEIVVSRRYPEDSIRTSVIELDQHARIHE